MYLDFGKDKQFANWQITISKDVDIGKPSNYMGPFPAALKLPEYLLSFTSQQGEVRKQ